MPTYKLYLIAQNTAIFVSAGTQEKRNVAQCPKSWLQISLFGTLLFRVNKVSYIQQLSKEISNGSGDYGILFTCFWVFTKVHQDLLNSAGGSPTSAA